MSLLHVHEWRNDYVIAHRRGVTAAACLVFGLVLLISGLIQLV